MSVPLDLDLVSLPFLVPGMRIRRDVMQICLYHLRQDGPEAWGMPATRGFLAKLVDLAFQSLATHSKTALCLWDRKNKSRFQHRRY